MLERSHMREGGGGGSDVFAAGMEKGSPLALLKLKNFTSRQILVKSQFSPKICSGQIYTIFVDRLYHF